MNITGDPKLIAGAFIKARGEMTSLVAKDGKGNYGKYATLAAIVEAVTGPFAKHGLAVMQETGTDEFGVTISTFLIHESGATMDCGILTMPLSDRKPQAVGSAITYGRRYALAAVCGLAPDDDDGQAAQNTYNAPKATQKPQAAPKADVADDAMWEPDIAPRATEEQLARLNELGETYYSAQWQQVKDRNVKRISAGKAQKAGDLTPDQIQKLIDGITGLMSSKATNGVAK